MRRRERRTVESRHIPASIVLALVLVVATLAAAGCGRGREDAREDGAAAANNEAGGNSEQLSGDIVADGSSTVAPLTTSAAERFAEQQPGVRVTVGTSGTGGGFEKFCNGETDISDASRPIKDDEEAPICEENGIEYTELRVATDALTVVVNAENDWADCLTVEQLKAIWEPGSEITSWSEIPGGDFPDEKVVLAGPGTDSGTFDYFTDEVNGEEGASRSDYTASEDDNVIVRAVQGAKGGMGYFGFSYYEENQDTLKALAIDGGEGCVEPSVETAQASEYAPLARPLFVYVKNESLRRPEMKAFVEYYIRESQAIAEDALFVPLTDDQESEALAALEAAVAP
jgi:phosphate transport system substrate-binding protein